MFPSPIANAIPHTRYLFALVAVVLFAPIAWADDREDHWAWKVPVRPKVPTVSPQPANPIDAFIRAKLQAAKLSPAPRATREQLIRRVTFDLTGLPPTPEEVSAFVKDDSSDAWAKVIDRLLGSPHYGERWGRHWLDLARYADTNGYEFDEPRPDAWRYRDYVIRSFNEDKPFNQFIIEQIAGDEANPNSHDALIATGFNLLGPDMTDAEDQDQRRLNTLNDMTDTTALAFLGLTLTCCRCHDHKFEPIPQTDYFRFQAFFQPAAFHTDLVVATPAQQEAYAKAEAKYLDMTKELRDAISQEKDKKKLADLKAELKKFDKHKPKMPTAMGLADKPGNPPKTFVLGRGELSNRGDEVKPGFPITLTPGNESIPATISKVPDSTGRRLTLAKWIADPKNPLTARVIVNRLWQHHFGRGIVQTASDFGIRGERPTHPELLDWLACELANPDLKGGGDPQPWKLKRMHRLMLLSETYQQSTQVSDAAAEHDPDNLLFSRMNRLRLEGEAVRDSLLAISGRLNPKMGGPGVVLPETSGRAGGSRPVTATKDTTQYTRRSVYLFSRRNLRDPFLEVFDLPDSNLSCPKRERSTTAPQGLALLNSDEALTASKALADRLTKEAKTEAERIDRAYRLVLGRAPTDKEKARATAFLEDSPLSELCRALFNINEFVYLD